MTEAHRYRQSATLFRMARAAYEFNRDAEAGYYLSQARRVLRGLAFDWPTCEAGRIAGDVLRRPVASC